MKNTHSALACHGEGGRELTRGPVTVSLNSDHRVNPLRYLESIYDFTISTD